MSYIGKINVPKQYVYKNSTAYAGNTPGYNKRWEQVEIDIPHVSELLPQLGEPHYFSGDISHEHAYYYKQFILEDNKFNFGGSKITFIIGESEQREGIAENDLIYERYSRPERVEVDVNKYGTVSQSGSSINYGYFGQGCIQGGVQSQQVNLVPNFIEYLKSNTLGSSDVSGIKDNFNTQKDAFLVYDLSTTSEIYYPDYQGTGSLEGATLSENATDSNRRLINYSFSHNGTNDDINMYYKCKIQKTLRAKTDSGYTSQNVEFPGYGGIEYRKVPKPGATVDPDHYIYYYKNNMIAYAFLYDDVDVWVMTLTFAPVEHYHTEDNTSTTDSVNDGPSAFVMMCKVKDLPVSFPAFQEDLLQLEPSWQGTLSYPSSTVLMNDTFLELLNIEAAPGPGPSTDYDDDPIDPGTGTSTNPYENLRNNDAPAVVGGDYDLENHIYDIDDTPNT